MDLSKLRELALKKDQYNDIKKEIENAEKEYKSQLYKVRDELGNSIILSLSEENQIFSDFRLKDVRYTVDSNLFEVVLSYKNMWDYGVYMTVIHNNLLLWIPMLVDNKRDWGTSYDDRFRLFFQSNSTERASLNITEIQKAWDNVCEMYREDLNTLFEENK